MNRRLLRVWGFVLPIIVLLASCDTTKKFAYLQDVELTKRYAVQQSSDAVYISPGDRISIFVGSSYPELVAPFNGYGFDSSSPIAALNKSNGNQSDQELRDLNAVGYTVDAQGQINFPVLGRIHVAGKTVAQISTLLEERIIASKYVTDPRVEVRLSNFNIYLLGAIAGQGHGASGSGLNQSMQQTMFSRISGVNGGVLRVTDMNRINILEALALTGDLPENAEVNKIKVIRRDGDAYVTYALNMRSADVYNSPAFYLQPNDIVYVQPRYRRTESIDRAMQLSGYAFSTISSVVALLAILKLQK